MKYKTYAELKAAYDSGELSKENRLILDNDSCHVFVDEEQVFQGNGYEDLYKLAELCGFPVDWV